MQFSLLISRVPQLYKNVKRGRVTDISAAYLWLTIGANGTYVISIFLKHLSNDFYWAEAPWIVGCLVQILCDAICLIQMAFCNKTMSIYSADESETDDNSENQLNDDNSIVPDDVPEQFRDEFVTVNSSGDTL